MNFCILQMLEEKNNDEDDDEHASEVIQPLVPTTQSLPSS